MDTLGYWLCTDCMFFLSYDERPECDARESDVVVGAAKLPPLAADFTEDNGQRELSTKPCECCRTPEHGDRFLFSEVV